MLNKHFSCNNQQFNISDLKRRFGEHFIYVRVRIIRNPFASQGENTQNDANKFDNDPQATAYTQPYMYIDGHESKPAIFILATVQES